MSEQIPGQLEIQNSAETVIRITLNGDTADIAAGGEGQHGDLILRDSEGKVRIHLGREKVGKPPHQKWVWALSIMTAEGTKAIHLDEAGTLVLGRKDAASGMLWIVPKEGSGGIRIGEQFGYNIVVKDQNSFECIILDTQEGVLIRQYYKVQAGRFEIHNPSNGNPALEGSTHGVGCGVLGRARPDQNTYGALGVFRPGDFQQQWPGPVGVYGRSDHDEGSGVIGVGHQGVTGFSKEGTGVGGHTLSGKGVYGWSGDNISDPIGSEGQSWAGYFYGNLYVNSYLESGGKYFKIDHPLDPANKYLRHSSVESAERLNIYNGNAILDTNGEAWVQLPDWFEALNTDFCYQLTAVGEPAPNLHVAQEVSDNRFKMAGGRAGMKVSWQVTGVRQDAYAKAHPMQVEIEKREAEQGAYMHPIEHGLNEDQGISYEQTRRIREEIASMKQATHKTK